ncbi:MAG TPA: DUF2130 domain-containing protein [Puia sp.]|nr:DUF2130 domain-containing protein [Puia sp.]
MPTNIKCPSCGHQFPMEEAVSEEFKRDLRDQMVIYKKQKEEEFSKKERDFQHIIQNKDVEFAKKLQDEKRSLEQSLEINLRKSISSDYEVRLNLLQQSNKDNEEKLKLSREKELEFLRKVQELRNKESELEISLQRKLLEEREKIKGELLKEESSRMILRETEFQLRLKELEKQLDDQKKLTEEMKRRQEQGSMQLQGEVQELLLEEILRNSFPFDEISEVSKGVRGADCIQIVRNGFGQPCGKIIYESKRTENFSSDWIEKLKIDMRSQGADIAVIVTKTMPKDMSQFGEKNGVWICSFNEAKALTHVIRDGIINIFNATKNQQNKGDKMHLLYDYLTSNEFSEQWKAIREGFMSMKQSIQKERDMMEKLWKAREKQLEKVLLNSAHVKGSIEGIAGQDSIDLNLLEDNSGNLLGE